jgi:molybdopterin-containing oxidoreductase family iron-sulfur binding subunit
LDELAKYGMVLNIDRCVGCYTCVVACKMAYGTRPGVNYNGVKRVEWGEYPDAKQRYALTMCMHCDDAPCVKVCPVKATTKTAEGAVVVDYETCIGCGECVKNCPYGQRYLVEDNAPTSFEGAVLPYEEESVQRSMVVEKCMFCTGRLANGQQPMCTVHCPAQCRIFGDVDDPESDISKYIANNNAAKLEGTSIYYVTPAGMSADLLPPPLPVAMQALENAKATPAPIATTAPATPAPTATPAPAPAEESSGAGAIVAGVVGVAAVAAAGGYMYSKKKKSENNKGGVK